jgi:hypothetical protein
MSNYQCDTHETSRAIELLSHPFYQRRLRPWGTRPARDYARVEANGCMTWQGCVNSRGYPSNAGGLVHRQAWEAFHGPLPAGNEVHHLCGNKRCISVAHLESLTPHEHRRVEGRQKLDEHQVRQILMMIASGVSHSRIAARFGIRRAYVSQIKQGRVWPDVVSSFWSAHGGSPARGRVVMSRAA